MIEDFYTQIIIIQRKTATTNNFGGQSETWATHLTIEGIIDAMSGQKVNVADQYAEKCTHILFCATGYDITIADRVLYDSHIYRILPVDEPFGHHAEIPLELYGVDQ